MTHSISKHLEQLLYYRFHVAAFTRLLERMEKTEEANGTTLLDNTIFTLGAGMGDGTHTNTTTCLLLSRKEYWTNAKPTYHRQRGTFWPTFG